MRLPTDATLLLGDGADPELERVWREERLPLAPLGGGLREADLEALATATIVACGIGGPQAAALAARLGFRTFLVGDAAPEGASAVTLAQALEGAKGARARERWKSARAASA
jgi:thiazole synthase ThiGH ThiG subunit